MADIPLPTDVGRVRHLTAQMHKSEDDAGDPIPEGFVLGADGARGHTWYDPADFGGGGSGHYELLMAAGSSPIEPLENGDGTDWLYVWVP